MEVIDPHILQNIKGELNSRLIDDIVKFLFDRKKSKLTKDEWFEQYLEDILKDYFIPERGQIIDYSIIKKKHIKKRQDNKRSWIKSLKEHTDSPNNPLEQEYFMRQKVAREIDNNQINELLNESLDTFMTKKLEELEIWRKNKYAPISSFPYLHTKTKSQIKLAFQVDIVLDISEFLIQNNGKMQKETLFQVEAFVNNPIFSGKSFALETQDAAHDSLYNDYVVDDDFVLRTIIKLNEGDTVRVKKNTTLDEKDSTIIQYILSQRDELFFTNRTIEVDLRDLVKVIYGTCGTKQNDLIEKRLKKIKNYNIEAIINNTEYSKPSSVEYSIFDRIFVGKNPKINNGNRYVEIVVGDTIYQQVINSKIISVYRDSFGALNNPISRVLIYALQKERLERHINHRSLEDLYSYKFFLNRVRFKDPKNINDNLAEIYNSLHEFKKQNILIQDLKQVYQSFEITFIPLSNIEINDFFRRDKEQAIEISPTI
ncbi:replication initiator protein A [Bacillus sp. FJAT-45037]|uniref:replication initiator protein A n=1 Tax=Bacillus sp. FJAT-45037 TaxID=2011007 RepID=UPI000C24B61D|nr:replication initiator protein A [Bacillus sp. FJAT-45037]